MLLDQQQNIHYDQLLAYKLALEEQGHQVILLDSGNTIQGSLFTNMKKGETTIEVMNMVGYDAINVGYHDMIFGDQQWRNLHQIASFPILSSNLIWNEDPITLPYTMFTVDQLKIAVVGLTSPRVVEINQHQLSESRIIDPFAHITSQLEELSTQADHIILMTSLGENSSEMASRIITLFPDILLIIDSDHILLDSDGEIVQNSLIINNVRYAKSMNHTTLTIQDNQILTVHNKRLTTEDLHLNEAQQQHPAVQEVRALMQRLRAEAEALTQETIILLPQRLNGEKESVRTRQTLLGSIITDSFRLMSNADIAFINGGAIRASLPKGEISYANIFNVMPFDNSIIIITLTGQQIKEALEHSVSQLPEDFSGLLHVSGLTYNYIVTPEGNSVLDIWFHQRPLNLTKNYKVAITTFLHQGGDGFSVFEQPIEEEIDKDINLFTSYISSYPYDTIYNTALLPRALRLLETKS
ncbi:bifunctional metallophosphatase/5'-nucleotidase [Entomospira culicis]|nr:5'-nucleotidase C-terminal domain-containing protein [Entomospira culicis]